MTLDAGAGVTRDAARAAGVNEVTGAELAGLLQALGDPVRLRVVEALSRSAERAGDLAVAAGVPAATMSKHLRALLSAGVVIDERDARDARVRVFRLRPESVVAVRAWLDQLQAHWDEQLRAFGAYVEQAHGGRADAERGHGGRADGRRDHAERADAERTGDGRAEYGGESGR
jgi:DNA-binding transcriptional ArsR family regulator